VLIGYALGEERVEKCCMRWGLVDEGICGRTWGGRGRGRKDEVELECEHGYEEKIAPLRKE